MLKIVIALDLVPVTLGAVIRQFCAMTRNVIACAICHLVAHEVLRTEVGVTQENVGRRLWSNSASGYTRNLLRLLIGVVSFRLLCTSLSIEELGFYSLMWSFLGYGVLFDLGLGVAVKKRTAELLQSKDFDLLGRVLSTVFFVSCFRAIVTIGIGLFAADELLKFVGTSPEHMDGFRTTVYVFVIGMSIMFPLEMFREVHCGQQRIAIAERMTMLGGIVSFFLLVCSLRWHWGLPAIFGAQFICLIAIGLALAFSALRVMPEVRVRWRFVSWRVLRSLSGFSAMAYLAAFAGIVVIQADRFLVGAVLSVASVATYHIGAKIPELFSTFARQLPEALGPAAASVHSMGERSHWQVLFLRGIRINALIATPIFCLSHFFLESLLEFLARGRASDNDIVVLARILLCFTYSTILTHGIGKSIFLMCGHEAPLIRLLGAEALVNVVTSVILLKWLDSPLGAALGSLLPALVFGWGIFWPWMAREIGLTPFRLARETILPAWKAAVPLVVVGLAWRYVFVTGYMTQLLAAVGVAIVAMIASSLGTWRFALSTEEQVFLAGILKGNWPRRRTRNAGETPTTYPDAP